MEEFCQKIEEKDGKEKLGDDLPRSDVSQQTDARASTDAGVRRSDELEHPPKKRKTRRGKPKRRHPYVKNKNARKVTDKLIKPEAPHNSNEFLLEDHALIEELDENLRVTPSTLRTRDSSFSVDTDGGEFYSSPEDEEQFLIKDFCDQYESLHAERLQAMSKAELIQEYLMLENKLDQMSKRLLQKTEDDESEDSRSDLKKEVERLTVENERLKRENEALLKKTQGSDSEDSETDSSSSCSSSSSTCSSSCSNRSRSPINNAYSQTNGHAHSPPETVKPV